MEPLGARGESARPRWTAGLVRKSYTGVTNKADKSRGAGWEGGWKEEVPEELRGEPMDRSERLASDRRREAAGRWSWTRSEQI